MKNHLIKNKYFYLISAAFMLIGAAVVIFVPKQESVLRLNGIESKALDFFFAFITRMGEWLGGLIVALIIVYQRPIKYLLFFLLAILISSSASTLLKHEVFEKHKRPSAFFQEKIKPITGVHLHEHYSFPSGHTTAAFCMFSMLAFTMRKRIWQIGAALIACLAGISRVYLAQHFPEDVIAGAFLGTFVATLVFVSVSGLKSAPWMEYKVFKA